jgi:glycosyltransferase involved in cell wall biosynthesis
MRHLLADAPLRERLGAAARANVNESWTVEAMVARIDDLYRRLLA